MRYVSGKLIPKQRYPVVSLMVLILVTLICLITIKPDSLDDGTTSKSKLAETSSIKPDKLDDGIISKPIVTEASSTKPVTPSTKAALPAPASLFATTPAWAQDFSNMPDGPLSNSTWGYDLGNGGPDVPGWGNNEAEYYTSNLANARIEGSELIIEALQQSDSGFDYTSARLTTLPSLNFTYGKLDIVAELPSGVGSWPAMWLLPSSPRYEQYTPADDADPNNYLRDGEIDMMEATGSLPGQVTSSAQSYVYNPINNNERIAVSNVTNDTTTFHDYELQWTPTSLSFLIDGVAYNTVNKAPNDPTTIWPYNQPYYLILNIAMGGTEGGTETAQYPPLGIDNSSEPWEMTIKSIDYYPYIGSASSTD
jgi:beta-glucanase (GH16 family)